MKKLLLLIVLFVFGCHPDPVLNSNQDDKIMKMIEEEISYESMTISNLAERCEAIKDTASRNSIKKEIEMHESNLSYWTSERSRMLKNFSNSNEKVPTEINDREKKNRENSLEIQQKNIILDKLKKSPDNAGSNDLSKVIIYNGRSNSVSFSFCGTNGERIDILVSAKKKISRIFLPGQYEVTYTDHRGREIGRKTRLVVNSTIHQYDGEECLGYVYIN